MAGLLPSAALSLCGATVGPGLKSFISARGRSPTAARPTATGSHKTSSVRLATGGAATGDRSQSANPRRLRDCSAFASGYVPRSASLLRTAQPTAPLRADLGRAQPGNRCGRSRSPGSCRGKQTGRTRRGCSRSRRGSQGSSAEQAPAGRGQSHPADYPTTSLGTTHRHSHACHTSPKGWPTSAPLDALFRRCCRHTTRSWSGSYNLDRLRS